MAKFSITADVLPVMRWLKAAAFGVKANKRAMALAGDYAVKSIRQNFLAGGRPEKWKPLSPVTLAMKLGKSKGKARAKKAKTNKVLIGLGMKGGLMGSIHYKASDSEVVIGPDSKPYAAIHQFGGMAGRNRKVKIPARPYMVLQKDDVGNIARIIENEIARAIAKGG